MRQHALPLLILGSVVLWAGTLGSVVLSGDGLMARMLKQKSAADIPWEFYTGEQIADGITLPANTNVVFSLPDSLSPKVTMTREALLGGRGSKVRYWGYCFPKPTIGKNIPTMTGLPGEVFLSEAERTARANAVTAFVKETFSALRPPKDAQKLNPLAGSPIRHQKEIFSPYETCFVMTGSPLPVGVDLDGDGMNTMVERNLGTDAENPDSDGDGMADGLEYQIAGSDPLRADTDNDGIGDGIEDANRNGRVDHGETNLLNADSDGDGLCDGLCPLGLANYALCPETSDGGKCIVVGPEYYNQPSADGDADGFKVIKGEWYAGEDKNRNGKVDSGEYDPTKASTFDDVNDFHSYLQCGLSNSGDFSNC